jgi:hypothetical protein
MQSTLRWPATAGGSRAEFTARPFSLTAEERATLQLHRPMMRQLVGTRQKPASRPEKTTRCQGM